MCPVCGAELSVDEFEPPCQHLIADWPDGSDGDDGILGESCRTKAALDRLPTLFSAFSRLVNLAVGRDQEADSTEDRDERSIDEEGLAGLRSKVLAPSEESPIWYQAFEECLSDISWPTYLDAAALVSAALEQCPGVSETMKSLGGPMISTSVTFVWAEDPAAAIACVDARLAHITAEIEAASNRLRTDSAKQ